MFNRIPNIKNIKKNFFYGLGILVVLSLFVIFYSGVKEGYQDIFGYTMILSPLIFILIPKNSVKVDLIFAVIIVFIISGYAILFWNYKDGLLFNKLPQEEKYWFSFENEIKFSMLYFLTSISAFITLIIRLVYSKKKEKKKILLKTM